MGTFSIYKVLRWIRPHRKSIWDKLVPPLTKTQLQEQLCNALGKQVLVIDHRGDLLHRDLRKADYLVWLDFHRRDRTLIEDLFEMLSQEPDAPLCLHLKSRRDVRLLVSTAKSLGRIPQKVLAYVIRPQEATRLLLVQKKDETAQIEVIRGSVDANETPEQSLLREVREESGLDLHDPHRFHFESLVTYNKKDALEFQLHHCYFLQAPESPPETWSHLGTGHGTDGGECFRYAWMPLRRAGAILQDDMREPLDRLRVYLRQSRETISLAPRLNVT